MTCWTLALSSQDFARLRPGDKVVFYVADAEAFGGTAELKIETVCRPGDYEKAAPVLPGWSPRAPMTTAQYEAVRLACEARAKGRPRPPGVPPNESERPPRIPMRVRKPSKRKSGPKKK